MRKILFISALLLTAALLCAGIAAADLPEIVNSEVVYIDYNNGKNANSGLSADEAKQMMAGSNKDGAVYSVPFGGTIVACGKIFLGDNYTLPKMTNPLKITSNDGTQNYLTELPFNNPATALKMKKGAVLTLQSDVIFDDIILFNEYADNNTIRVTNGATVVFGEGVLCITNAELKTPAYMVLEVEKGSTVILYTGIFQGIRGEGEVINYGAIILEDTAPVKNPEQTENDSSKPLTPDAPLASDIAYISYNSGNNDYSGLSADEPKQMLEGSKKDGAVSLVPGGGKIIACGKIFLGGDYTLPELYGTLKITSNDGKVNYLTELPENNPATALKMKKGATFTLQSDVIFDDIILFNEYAENNTIRVTNGATVVFGEGVKCITNANLKTPAYMVLEVEEGSTAILYTGIFQGVRGDGKVINYGAAFLDGTGPERIEKEPEASGFAATRTYTDVFTDVAAGAWYYPFVRTAFEYGLANGTSASAFSPSGKFTVAQALTAAANISAVYSGKTIRDASAGEAWYAPYIEYCISDGIISEEQFPDPNRNITRGEMATVFANILPDTQYTAIRDGGISDVTEDMACFGAVQKLYRAGIVGGDAGSGNYRPNDEINRAEACVIFTRIAVTEYRQK